MKSKKNTSNNELKRYNIFMGNFGIGQIAIVVVLVVLLFGRGKISDLMGDVAKGIKSFKKGMSDNTDKIDSSDKPSDKDHNSENK